MITMKLQDPYYNYILKGTKRIEIRLYDEKRKEINLGDKITFINDKTKEELVVKVVGLLHYQTFEDMFKDFPVEVLADKSMTKDELKNILEEFYPREKQEEYSVLGIRIELDK